MKEQGRSIVSNSQGFSPERLDLFAESLGLSEEEKMIVMATLEIEREKITTPSLKSKGAGDLGVRKVEAVTRRGFEPVRRLVVARGELLELIPWARSADNVEQGVNLDVEQRMVRRIRFFEEAVLSTRRAAYVEELLKVRGGCVVVRSMPVVSRLGFLKLSESCSLGGTIFLSAGGELVLGQMIDYSDRLTVNKALGLLDLGIDYCPVLKKLALTPHVNLVANVLKGMGM